MLSGLELNSMFRRGPVSPARRKAKESISLMKALLHPPSRYHPVTPNHHATFMAHKPLARSRRTKSNSKHARRVCFYHTIPERSACLAGDIKASARQSIPSAQPWSQGRLSWLGRYTRIAWSHCLGGETHPLARGQGAPGRTKIVRPEVLPGTPAVQPRDL